MGLSLRGATSVAVAEQNGAVGQPGRRKAEGRTAAVPPSPPPSTPKLAIARMRSSIVSINNGDPTQPIGSGVIVRGENDDDGIVATALHVVRGVAAEHLEVGFPVPPSEQGRGSVTMLGANVVATDERNDLALLEMESNAPVTRGVPHPSGDSYLAAVAELDAARPEDGEPVMISGFPLGYRYLVNSAGIIACSWGDHQILEDPEEATGDAPLDRYLVDINVNPGNSGGPCYCVTDQRVIGICEAVQLVEVHFEDDPNAPLAIDDAHRAALQKADITFVVPAKYVVALLETI
jgi:S1-C subfamily serine protease